MSDKDKEYAVMAAFIEETALKLVKTEGLMNLTRRMLCERATIPEGSFSHIMGVTFVEFVDHLKTICQKQDPRTKIVRERAHPGLRKESILHAATELAADVGYKDLTRDRVADAAGVSPALVSRYFSTMCQLKNSVVRYAVTTQVLPVIAQAIANSHPKVKNLDMKLKTKAIETLINH